MDRRIKQRPEAVAPCFDHLPFLTFSFTHGAYVHTASCDRIRIAVQPAEAGGMQCMEGGEVR